MLYYFYTNLQKRDFLQNVDIWKINTNNLDVTFPYMKPQETNRFCQMLLNINNIIMYQVMLRKQLDVVLLYGNQMY